MRGKPYFAVSASAGRPFTTASPACCHLLEQFPLFAFDTAVQERSINQARDFASLSFLWPPARYGESKRQPFACSRRATCDM